MTSRPASNQEVDYGTSGSGDCGKVRSGHRKDTTQNYMKLGWLVEDFLLCTFTHFTSVRRLSLRFFE